MNNIVAEAKKKEYEAAAEDCALIANYLAFKSFAVLQLLFALYPFTKENKFNSIYYNELNIIVIFRPRNSRLGIESFGA